MAQIARRMVSCMVLAIILAAHSDATGETVLHTERSLYRNITVYENDDERCMRFSRQSAARQTCISLSNPNHLVFNYTKMMMGTLYLQPEPREILIIGLGGGTLPSTISKILPRAEIDVVEIDPAVVRVAKKFFGFVPKPTIRVFEQDGRVFVKRAIRSPKRYDLVILDAFDQDYIPEHLLTREFLEEVKRVMAPQGVLAANAWSSSRLYDNESVTYESVFGRFFNLKTTSRVIIVRNNGLPGMNLIRENAKALERHLVGFDVGSSYLLPLFSTERDWDSGARILTDQYSPSNLLNER